MPSWRASVHSILIFPKENGSMDKARPDDELEILRHFTRLVAAEESARTVWQRVDAELRFALQSAYLLLDHNPGEDAESFITFTLERLSQCIRRVNEPLQVEYQGQVRGRVIWPATFKARYREDHDPSRYVCRQLR